MDIVKCMYANICKETNICPMSKGIYKNHLFIDNYNRVWFKNNLESIDRPEDCRFIMYIPLWADAE